MVWPEAKIPEADGAIIKDDGACGCHIDAKLCRDLDNVVAHGQGFRAQRTFFRAENVGGARRVPEGRQINRIIDQLDADHGATLGQDKIVHRVPLIERRVAGGSRRVRFRPSNRIVRVDREDKTGVKGVRGAKDIPDIHRFGYSFDTNSEIASQGVISNMRV